MDFVMTVHLGQRPDEEARPHSGSARDSQRWLLSKKLRDPVGKHIPSQRNRHHCLVKGIKREHAFTVGLGSQALDFGPEARRVAYQFSKALATDKATLFALNRRKNRQFVRLS